MLIALSAAVIAAVPQEHITLHPQSAAISLQVSDVQGLIATYKKTAGARMLADPELQAAVGLMMAGEGAPPVDPMAMMMGRYDAMVASGDMAPLLSLASGLKSVSFSVDVPNGDLFAFQQFTEQFGWDEKEQKMAEGMGLRLVADFVSEEAQEAMVALMSEEFINDVSRDMEFQAMSLTREDAGAFGSKSVTVWRYASTTDEELAVEMGTSMGLIAGGTRMALVMGNVDVMDFVDVLGSGTADANAMATYAAGRKAIGGVQGVPVFEAHINPYIESIVMDAEPLALPLLDLVEGLVGPMASMVIRGGHWRLSLDPVTGQFIMEGAHAPSKAGATAGLLGASPVDASALTLAHPDALVTTVTSLDKNVLVNLLNEMAKMEGPEAFDELDANYGFRPDRDLAQPLGSAVSYSLPKLGSLLAAPNLMLAMDLDDKDGFLRGMDGLFKLAGEAGEGITVTRETYKGISTLYKLSMPGLFEDLPLEGLPVDLSKIIEPTIAVLEDRVVITMNRTHAKKEVRRVRNLLKEGAVQTFHAGIMGLGDLKGATTVSYADWAGFVGGIYSQLKAFGPMLAGALPVDVTALPSADVLTRHFLPSERRVRVVGELVRHSSRSSFGPEMTALPLLATFGMYTSLAAPMPMVAAAPVREQPMGFPGEEPIEVGGTDLPTINTTVAFTEVAVAITLYQLDQDDKLPATLADLSLKSKNYPGGYLEGALPKDGWGGDLLYRVEGTGFVLWSKGLNGQDEQGAGDDVIAD